MTRAQSRLYAIADDATWGGATPELADRVVAMAEAGVGWIQLRVKVASDRDCYELAATCCRRLEGAAVQLWIDDRTDLAALLPPLAGVHLGQCDLWPAEARKLLGAGQRIGHSTHTLDQVSAAEADAAVDVVALGPIFATRSKKGADDPVGLESLIRARALTGKKLVAIGGIDAERIVPTLEAGADAVAVIGALGSSAAELERRCRELLALTA